MELPDGRDEQRRPGNCQPIAHVLARLMARKGYAQLQGASELEALWKEICGELASKSRCGRIQQGRLEIIVENSVVLQELTFRKSELVARLRQLAPQHGIEDLRLRIGTLS